MNPEIGNQGTRSLWWSKGGGSPRTTYGEHDPKGYHLNVLDADSASAVPEALNVWAS